MLRKRNLAIAVSLVLIGLVATFLVADTLRGMAKQESVSLAGSVLDRVHVGMTRTEVEQQIGRDAKKRYRCDYLADVYLIGDADPGRASILYFRFQKRADGIEVLDTIGGLDEDMLFSFESCPSTGP